MRKLYYTVSEITENDRHVQSHSPLALCGFDLEPLSNNVGDYVYTECPVWKHKADRTYVMRSPVDIAFQCDGPVVLPLGGDNNMANSSMAFVTPSEGDVMQLMAPFLCVWTDAKNIWVDVDASPVTSLNNNFVAVGGQWNLSRWTRPLSFAMHVMDASKPVVIKRGDPIYQVTFRSSNLNEKFQLIRKESIPDEVRRGMIQATGLKEYVSKLSSKFIFSEQRQCPLRFR